MTLLDNVVGVLAMTALGLAFVFLIVLIVRAIIDLIFGNWLF